MSRRGKTVRLRDTVPRRSTRVLAKSAEWRFLNSSHFLDWGIHKIGPPARLAINRGCLTILYQQEGLIMRQGIRQASLAQLRGWPSRVRLAWRGRPRPQYGSAERLHSSGPKISRRCAHGAEKLQR
jgi:hypothetical protein